MAGQGSGTRAHSEVVEQCWGHGALASQAGERVPKVVGVRIAERVAVRAPGSVAFIAAKRAVMAVGRAMGAAKGALRSAGRARTENGEEGSDNG